MHLITAFSCCTQVFIAILPCNAPSSFDVDLRILYTCRQKEAILGEERRFNTCTLTGSCTSVRYLGEFCALFLSTTILIWRFFFLVVFFFISTHCNVFTLFLLLSLKWYRLGIGRFAGNIFFVCMLRICSDDRAG